MTTDTLIRLLCAPIVNAVAFGVGAVTVLSVPSLNDHAKYLLPAVIVLSFALAPIGSIFVARRMRIRNWGRRAWSKGDLVSG